MGLTSTTNGGGDGGIIVLGEYKIRRDGKYCSHRHRKFIDEYGRRVTCGTCEAILDPFDCLLQQARHHEHLLLEWQRLEAEVKARRATIDQLKIEERNTRARLKRLAQVSP